MFFHQSIAARRVSNHQSDGSDFQVLFLDIRLLTNKTLLCVCVCICHCSTACIVATQAFADGLKYHDAIWSQSIEMVMRRLPTRENTAV